MAESSFRPDVLAGKVAFVTGGGSGIGFEIARQLGLHGAKVAIMGRRDAVLKESVRKLESDGIVSYSVTGDVRKSESCVAAVEAVVQNFGSLSILVNCAAGNFLASAESLSPNGFKTVLEIDTIGTFNVTHAAFKALRESKGSIINISAFLDRAWYQIHAASAKVAINQMTKSWAMEWGEYGIRANAISPGIIGGTTGMAKLSGGAGMEKFLKSVPLRRLGTTKDIGLTAVFLCTESASYISGEVIQVDGAFSIAGTPPAPREVIAAFSRGMEKKPQTASKL